MDEAGVENFVENKELNYSVKHWGLEFKILEFYYVEVFKFGGASVKDAEGIKMFMTFYKVGYEDVLLVVSAMGKTTNALEVVIKTILISHQHFNPLFKK
jgi:hypothetical protein